MKIISKFFAIVAMIALSAGPSIAHEFTAGDIEIIHPTARATVPGAKVAGAFMVLSNEGSEDDTLTAVTAPDISDDVQLHEMAVVDDVMKMRKLPGGVALPAGEVVELKPGGLHVMFMNIKKQLVEGEMFKAALHFEKAGDVDIEFMVGAAAGGAMKHDGKDMEKMD